MNFKHNGTERLFNLIKKMANIVTHNQPDSTDATPLYIHNNRTGNCDDLWFFPKRTDSTTEQPLVKVALVGLSNEKRTQLDQALNKEMEYLGRSEHVDTIHQKTALFKFIQKSAETNIKSIEASK